MTGGSRCWNCQRNSRGLTPFQGCSNVGPGHSKPENRNPKSEGNPKPEIRKGPAARPPFGFLGCRTWSSLNWPDFRATLTPFNLQNCRLPRATLARGFPTMCRPRLARYSRRRTGSSAGLFRQPPPRILPSNRIRRKWTEARLPAPGSLPGRRSLLPIALSGAGKWPSGKPE